MTPAGSDDVLMTKDVGVAGAAATASASVIVVDCAGELASVAVTPKE
jgi:hypothetical protein